MLDPLPILPFTQPAAATVRLPGSKSITNRALVLAALAEGETILSGALFSEDTEIMIDSLCRLGFSVEADREQETIRVRGEGGRIPSARASLSLGNAGTAARFLTALCCLSDEGTFDLDGVPQMRKRPMRGLLNALMALGARIESLDQEGHFPIRIHANGLTGGRVRVDAAASSQMLSALLMVAPFAKNDTILELGDVRLPFVRMTLRMMEQFGQHTDLSALEKGNREVRVTSGIPYRANDRPYPVEADVTAASYFATLPFVTGGTVSIGNFSHIGKSLQGDSAYFGVLEKLGCRITADGDHGTRFEFSGPSAAQAMDEDFSRFSDTFLTLAAVSPLLPVPLTIRGIAHTRKQETDRIAGMTQELRKLGQDVREFEDGLAITPDRSRLGAEKIHFVDTYRDHRFAMSFALLGLCDLRGDGTPWLAIRDPGCCAKTFPDFFRALEFVYQRSHGKSSR